MCEILCEHTLCFIKSPNALFSKIIFEEDPPDTKGPLLPAPLICGRVSYLSRFVENQLSEDRAFFRSAAVGF